MLPQGHNRFLGWILFQMMCVPNVWFLPKSSEKNLSKTSGDLGDLRVKDLTPTTESMTKAKTNKKIPKASMGLAY